MKTRNEGWYHKRYQSVEEKWKRSVEDDRRALEMASKFDVHIQPKE